jgi:hypothetical protein
VPHARSLEKLSEAAFQLRFVPTRDQARRVTGQIRELNHKARKSRAGPTRSIGPDCKVLKHALYHRLSRS